MGRPRVQKRLTPAEDPEDTGKLSTPGAWVLFSRVGAEKGARLERGQAGPRRVLEVIEPMALRDPGMEGWH